jgi:hypothetical protein
MRVNGLIVNELRVDPIVCALATKTDCNNGAEVQIQLPFFDQNLVLKTPPISHYAAAWKTAPTEKYQIFISKYRNFAYLCSLKRDSIE